MQVLYRVGELSYFVILLAESGHQIRFVTSLLLLRLLRQVRVNEYIRGGELSFGGSLLDLTQRFGRQQHVSGDLVFDLNVQGRCARIRAHLGRWQLSGRNKTRFSSAIRTRRRRGRVGYYRREAVHRRGFLQTDRVAFIRARVRESGHSISRIFMRR